MLRPPPLRGAEDIVDGVVVVGVDEAEKKVAAPATKRTTSNPFRPPRRRAMKRNAPIDHRGRANPHTVTVPLNMESPDEPSAGGVEDAPCRCICPFTMTILLIGSDIACLPLMNKAEEMNKVVEELPYSRGDFFVLQREQSLILLLCYCTARV